MDMKARYAKLAATLEAEGVDAFLIGSGPNARYFEGYSGEGYLLASADRSFVITDTRYTEWAQNECKRAEVLIHRRGPSEEGDLVAGSAKRSGWKRVAFDPTSMTYAAHAEIAKSFAAAGIEFVPVEINMAELRAVKDAEEIELTERACRIADEALERFLPNLRPGVTELEMQAELDHIMKKLGSESESFSTMMLFGAKSSQPHATPSADARLQPGDLVLIDYGASVGGYRSDTTRTFVCGEATPEQRAAYNAVLEAQMITVGMVRPGAICRDLHDKAVSVIEENGIPVFEHSLGHGVGLQIHEMPKVGPRSDTPLEPNMIITIEPGSYRPGWGGIRIEDTVLVTPEGGRTLTFFPKTLTELPIE